MTKKHRHKCIKAFVWCLGKYYVCDVCQICGKIMHISWFEDEELPTGLFKLIEKPSLDYLINKYGDLPIYETTDLINKKAVLRTSI